MCSCSSFIKLSSQHFKNRHGSFIMPHQFSSSITARDLNMFCTSSFAQSLGRVHKHEVLLMSAFNPEPKTTSRLHAKAQDHAVILAKEGEDQLTHPHSSPPMMAAAPTFSSITSSQADMALMETQIYSPSEMMAKIQPSTIQLRDERALRKKTHQLTYLFAAVASSIGITSLAAASVYYRFSWQMEGGEVPWTEMLGTFSLALGAAVGMEYWARWAHRALWHHSLWHMHESHHRAREGPFELNDIFAIINAVPAIALMAFGFLHKGLVPGLCFGAGLGITVFGIAYMFVHDGLVHRRFSVGPIADVPYFQRVAGAHQLHHADTFNGVPYGLFLGPKELEEVGGRTELEKVLQKRKRERTNPING